MSRPPLHALQGFVATARSGNLSRTAETLHLTVSALSHQIRGLEERLTGTGARYWVFPQGYDQRVAAILAAPDTAKQ